jgi:hypothetical protein
MPCARTPDRRLAGNPAGDAAWLLLSCLLALWLQNAPAAAQPNPTVVPSEEFKEVAVTSFPGPMRLKQPTQFDVDFTYSLVFSRPAPGPDAINMKFAGNAGYALVPGPNIQAHIVVRDFRFSGSGRQIDPEKTLEGLRYATEIDWAADCRSATFRNLAFQGYRLPDPDTGRRLFSLVSKSHSQSLWCLPMGVRVGDTYEAPTTHFMGPMLTDALGKISGTTRMRIASLGNYAGRFSFRFVAAGNVIIDVGKGWAMTGTYRNTMIVDIESGLVLKSDTALALGGTKENGGPFLVNENSTQRVKQLQVRRD